MATYSEITNVIKEYRRLNAAVNRAAAGVAAQCLDMAAKAAVRNDRDSVATHLARAGRIAAAAKLTTGFQAIELMINQLLDNAFDAVLEQVREVLNTKEDNGCYYALVSNRNWSQVQLRVIKVLTALVSTKEVKSDFTAEERITLVLTQGLIAAVRECYASGSTLKMALLAAGRYQSAIYGRYGHEDAAADAAEKLAGAREVFQPRRRISDDAKGMLERIENFFQKGVPFGSNWSIIKDMQGGAKVAAPEVSKEEQMSVQSRLYCVAETAVSNFDYAASISTAKADQQLRGELVELLTEATECAMRGEYNECNELLGDASDAAAGLKRAEPKRCFNTAVTRIHELLESVTGVASLDSLVESEDDALAALEQVLAEEEAAKEGPAEEEAAKEKAAKEEPAEEKAAKEEPAEEDAAEEKAAAKAEPAAKEAKKKAAKVAAVARGSHRDAAIATWQRADVAKARRTQHLFRLAKEDGEVVMIGSFEAIMNEAAKLGAKQMNGGNVLSSIPNRRGKFVKGLVKQEQLKGGLLVTYEGLRPVDWYYIV